MYIFFFIFSVEEIISFSQFDLAPEMAAVLDAHTAVFVWLGAHCSTRARDDARGLALSYLTQGRNLNFYIILIK